jgi:acyl-CoA thioester hydrolase
VTSPKTGYVGYFRVRFSECDPLGHVNNAVYLSYLEQTAIDHAAMVGWASADLQREAGAVFVARKHEIEYLQPATEGTLLQVRTWPGAMSGARGTRHYEIGRVDGDPTGLVDRLLTPGEIGPLPRGELVVRAKTEWAFMNLATGRPTRIPAVVVRDFLVEE